MSWIQPHMTILFQGDSVTDNCRDYGNPNDLGPGYAKFVAELLNQKYPDYQLRFLNRGVSGNRTDHLLARWEEDCISLRPDFLSILIGINDTWRRFDQNDPTPTEVYEARYRNLLTQVRDRLHIPVMVMEPFLLETRLDQRLWREDLDAKIDVARRLAREFSCRYVPLDGLMAAEACRRPMEELCADGVHPTEAGARLIARAWVDTACRD